MSVLRYRESKRKAHLFLGMLYYFLALLAKEYAVSLIILIPMLVYIVKRASLKDSLMAVLPFFLVAVGYIAMRFSFVGIGGTPGETDLLNDPYKFANATQKLATKTEVLILYIKQLIYPNMLSYDYSYNTIPYVNFGNGLVLLSILVHLSMIGVAIYLFTKRNIISFAIAFYLLHVFLVSNYMLDIGATMGDRLVYHSSFGFAIVIGVLAEMLSKKIKQPPVRTAVLAGAGCLVVLVCGIKVIARNTDWKNDNTLYMVDAFKVPESALANGNSGMTYYNLAARPDSTGKDSLLILKSLGDLKAMPSRKERDSLLMQQAIYHLDKAVTIHPKYVNGYLNLAVCYMRMLDYDKARYYLDIVTELYPNNPILKSNKAALAANYYNGAMVNWEKDKDKSFKMVENAVALAPDNAEYWYNYGGMYYTVHNIEKARLGFSKALEVNPDYELAKKGLSALPPAPPPPAPN